MEYITATYISEVPGDYTGWVFLIYPKKFYRYKDGEWVGGQGLTEAQFKTRATTLGKLLYQNVSE